MSSWLNGLLAAHGICILVVAWTTWRRQWRMESLERGSPCPPRSPVFQAVLLVELLTGFFLAISVPGGRFWELGLAVILLAWGSRFVAQRPLERVLQTQWDDRLFQWQRRAHWSEVFLTILRLVWAWECFAIARKSL